MSLIQNPDLKDKTVDSVRLLRLNDRDPEDTKLAENQNNPEIIEAQIYDEKEADFQKSDQPDNQKVEMLDFSRCQIRELLTAILLKGLRLESEFWGAYMLDHDLKYGNITSLMNEEKVGLSIGKILNEIFAEMKVISLFDDYNTGISDQMDAWGRPVATDENGVYAGQIPVSPEAADNFVQNMKRVYQEWGIKSKGGFDFISESSRQKSAEKLISELEKLGKIQRKNSGQVFFVNPEAENKNLRRFRLRSANGHYSCAALDSSGFLGKENFDEVVHLIILPFQHFSREQDAVWEILKVLDLQPENYHNIFYDKDADPELVAAEFRKIFREELQAFLAENETLLQQKIEQNPEAAKMIRSWQKFAQVAEAENSEVA